ncbi:thiamine diphosphate-binding protein [Truncatella angustata]|uniref:Pyruvate decarboxylase n=1 Tax=Truncatella angustata TaxID=152316 RepID=A0A9P8U8W6_9PEZI|nr:thiamine diphosphate-binding protein [Truncatella angustata]KAH6645634.1 thiamine diphosphate-binding protein [Truncatella angustata]
MKPLAIRVLIFTYQSTFRSNMTPFTVGDYLAERLAQIGIRRHFVVPGDYNLVLLDKLEAHLALEEIGCTNELNCSLAAEGYARAHGIGACVVTYSVGAFSAFNGIGSAFAENLPVILISGAPNTNDIGQHPLHHTLGERDFTYQFEMASKITCCAVAVRRAGHAPELIDRALRTAALERKPAYIEIPMNLAGEACAHPGPIGAVLEPIPSNGASLEAAVRLTAEYLSTRQKPVILVGPKVRRAGAEKELLQLAETLGCAVVVQPAAKGFFPEDHPQFAGIFWGQVSTLAADAIVNWADVLLCVGTVFSDYSTVGWTALPGVPQLVVDADSVTLPEPNTHFGRVQLWDFLAGVADLASWNDSTMVEYNRLRPDPPLEHASDGRDRLTRKEVARQIQMLLTPETTVFADTGDSWFNGIQLRLPRGAEFEIEMQWGHIGWTLPASFGYKLAKPERRIIVMVGDGAFQMTAQDISQMVRWRTPVIVLLMNNRGYTIEVEIHDGQYNRIHDWNYALLVEAFNSKEGGGHALGLEAHDAGQFAETLKRAMAHRNGPTLIECKVHRDDCSKELITWGHFVAAANARPPTS